MGFLDWLFKRNRVDCPRCLGKGSVDDADIKRLKKEIFWVEGKCAYCNGKRKVHADFIDKVPVDLEYLTTDLSVIERYNLINGDEAALQRANEYRQQILQFVKDIEHLYYIENKEPKEIADHIYLQNGHYIITQSELQDVIKYIEKIISSKLNR